MQNSKQKKWDQTVFIIAGILISIYVVLRALCLGITDDEAWSYYNAKKFWYVETLCTGNTHWFNFVAIKMMVLLGLEKVWQLRWLSIISAFVFIYIGIVWIRSIKSNWIKLFAFAFLFLNHYLLEYFSLARGYTMALALMALSLLFLVKAFNGDKERKFIVLSLVMAGLSAIANFNFFYYFTAFCCLYFYSFYFKNGFIFLRDKYFYQDAFYAGGISLVVINALLFITECSNDIAGFGGTKFVDSIFGGYIERTFSTEIHFGNGSLTILSYLFLCVLMLGLYIGVAMYKKHGSKLYFFSSIILLLMLVLTFLTKNFFHVLYPIHRTALMFIPLFAIILVEFINGLRLQLIKKIAISIFFIFCLINFLLNFNFNSTTDYQQQIDAKSIYNLLNETGATKVGICPELYVVYLKYYSFQYPALKGEMINTMIPRPKQVKKSNNHLAAFDYLILFPPYNLKEYSMDKVTLQGMVLYPETNALVVKVIKQ